MVEELLRRGNLILARGNVPGVGLYRDVGGHAGPPGPLDRAEWRWVSICAAPVALESLGPEPDYRDPPPKPEQAALDVFA